MRFFFRPALAGVLLLAALGCQKKNFDGPTVDAFTGRLVADGKPVSFPPGEQVILRVFHRPTSKSWGIPIAPDGTFNIGWMPIGTYTAMLERPPKSAHSAPEKYVLKDGFKIVDGQTEYTIELGKGFKL
ncbi:MAG TPA: hypothetical protein VH120_09195 [Gemmataceae bacterium]|jgi:hypothetical protein|nr:hypothetical protein [Gemmataceae bacterium]